MYKKLVSKDLFDRIHIQPTGWGYCKQVEAEDNEPRNPHPKLESGGRCFWHRLTKRWRLPDDSWTMVGEGGKPTWISEFKFNALRCIWLRCSPSTFLNWWFLPGRVNVEGRLHCSLWLAWEHVRGDTAIPIHSSLSDFCLIDFESFAWRWQQSFCPLRGFVI